ncbi:unnamed protein product [Schistocephalus solidus]|uniref:Uncharacterized protein n=1 Tax=Schistocephalus solidus TaxID=70667 RepID=A0A183SLW0_SCHSO|nr:unnamed protein product [Schistocephalus solidus]
MNQLSLVAEHCVASGHTFYFQDAKILGRSIDQTARETLEAWHTVPTAFNRCTILPTAFQALRVQLNQRNRRPEARLVAVACKLIPSQNTGLTETMPHTNAFVGISTENANQQDLCSGVGLPAELPENSLKNLPVLKADSQVFRPLVKPLVLVAAYTKSLPFLNAFLNGDLGLRFLESVSALLDEAVMKTEEANSILKNPVLELIEENFDIYRHLNMPTALYTGFGTSSKERDPIFMVGFCQLYLADILMHCSVISLSIQLLRSSGE